MIASCFALAMVTNPTLATTITPKIKVIVPENTQIDAALSLNNPDETPIPRPETGLHTASINQLVVTHEGKFLSVSDDKTARLWSSDMKGEAVTLRVPIGLRNEGTLYAVATSPTKNTAVVGGSTGIDWDKSGSVYGFDLTTGKLTGRITGIQGTIRVLNYSQDGRYLVIGSGSGWLRVIDLTNKSLAMDSSICQDMLVDAKFLSTGQLVTACLDGQLNLYDAAFHKQTEYKLPNTQRPWQLAVSPKSDQIAVGSLDTARVSIFSVPDLRPINEFTGDSKQRGNLSVVAWSDDTVFAAGTYGDTQGIKYVRALNTKTKQINEWQIAHDTITSLIPLNDNKLAYSTAEPSLGIINFQDTTIQTRKRKIADFRDAFEGTFAVSEDGTAIDFGLKQKGQEPLRFDLKNRSIAKEFAPRDDMHNPVIPDKLNNWRNDSHTTLNGAPIALDQNEQSRSAAYLKDNDSTLIGADFSLHYWKAGKLIWTVPVSSTAWAVNLNQNGRFAIAALADGTIRWYDTKDGKELLTLLVLNDQRWIAWTPQGYFDHSDGAANLIGYHINQGKKDNPKFILSDQIHERFYRPDLLGKAIIDDNTLTNDTLTTAKAVVSEHRAPALRLVSWCANGQCNQVKTAQDLNKTQNVNSAQIKLQFALKDAGDGIGDVVIRRNKATVATRALPTNRTVMPSGEILVEETVSLEPGDNLLTITAFDKDAAVDAGEAIRLPIRYDTTAPTNAPTLYVISIGIDQYAASELNKLDNAVNDANGIIQSLEQHTKGLFSRVRPVALLNQQASLKTIKQTLIQVAKEAKPDDLIVLFLAGHGISLDGRYYFMPYDAKLTGNMEEQIKNTSLTQKTLSTLLSALPTSRVAVLIDSCNSGAFAVMGSVMMRNPTQERSWTGSLAQNTGRFVLAGTSTEQEALDGINGHGVFTSVLLEALSGKADQEQGNRDNRTNIAELLAYTKLRVPEEARKIAPTHAQNVSGFFAGSEFFDLTMPTQP